MSTVFCPNHLCGKEISDQFDKCPFCGTPIHEKNDEEVGSNVLKPQSPKPLNIERSGWYTYAVIILVLSVLCFVVLSIVSIFEEDITFFVIGLGEFILFSLFCGIVQLLAGIKHCLDKLQLR